MSMIQDLKPKIVTPPTNNAFGVESSFSHHHTLLGQDGENHALDRSGSTSAISSITLFTLMLAHQILNSSLPEISSRNSDAIEWQQKVTTAVTGDQQPMYFEYDDFDDVLEEEDAPTIEVIRGKQRMKEDSWNLPNSMKYYEKTAVHREWNGKPSAGKPARTSLSTEVLMTTTKPKFDSNQSIIKNALIHRRKRDLSTDRGKNTDRRIQINVRKSTLHRLVARNKNHKKDHKKDQKKKKDPTFTTLEGLFWNIVQHFLSVFLKYFNVFKKSYLPKFISYFF